MGLPLISDVRDALEPLRLGVSASEVHGSMTGFLCGGGQADTEDWLATLGLETEVESASTQSLLQGLATAIADGIRPPDLALELLLPAPEGGLEARALGLVDWCRGFLGGFGLAGVAADNLEPGTHSILGDLADIATTVPAMGDEDEDRAALDELVDHVRFAALLLWAQLSVPDGASRH